MRISYWSSDVCSSDLCRSLAQAPRNRRPHGIGNGERQLLPKCHLQAVAGAERINVARRLAIGRAHCIAERFRREPPIFLERSSAGAYFRSSEIKACAAARSRIRHEREIHHIVSEESTRFLLSTAPRSEESGEGKAG